ncbi:uncharacterized protein B0I36DRAFT_249907 [Microdochium trichocladiopsis]|uniref:Tyrosinase copper-binding domain-containing protein n=1 Tax=Microdochium trichocladiopsis TaxID=1682393 RepID=A0A9P8XWL6_9PEZI|nr:uncharacterized protein B0I36DRAFT_249907 [Microdochium trichocladiopsis]KAH7024584.1 hypothetical protein B0I36DRAFT_249907 [Microdochium trichocladiopsis]
MAGCRNDIRRRWGTLSAGERDNFVGAIRCLTQRPPRGIWGGARSLYDELVWVHSQQNGEIHGLDLFLPWHRYYLHVFKRLLIEQCGFNGPIPWWKETNNAGNFPASDIFSDRWFGALPQASNGAGQCLTNGAFGGLVDRINNRCVARGEIKSETNEITLGWEDICHGQQGNTFPQHRNCVELSNHSRMHRGLGPTMANAATSPADPVFFLHHQYVDWQWKRWQNAQPSRWQTISGCANKANPCAPLTRDTRLSSLGLYRDMTVGEILDTEGDVTCYTYDNLI